jgi:(p)ppGpp synthase/HD superfamily hydrolase
MSSQYKIASGLVEVYHADQMYGDKPYVYHLLGVAKLVTERGGDMTAQTVALLHDIIEDTNCSALALGAAGINANIVAAVKAITHTTGEERNDYLKRCSLNKVALEVKKCDTMFNLMSSFKEGNSKRIIKYTKQLKFLEEHSK